MVQGYKGQWKFTLPYTAEPGEGVYLFLFYLALGHLARFLGLSIPLVFHLTRILSSVLLLYTLWIYVGSIFEKESTALACFAVLAVGSGMGWLALPLGGFTSDFWIAEAYPFLSMYANPHFPLGLALLLTQLMILRREPSVWNILLAGLISVLMSIVNPFSVVAGIVAITAFHIKAFYNNRNFQRSVFLAVQEYAREIFPLLVGGLPVLVYDVMISRTHQALAIWNKQNITPTPALWDVFLSFSPWFVLGIAVFLVGVFKRQLNRHAVWMILSLVLMYLPFSLQRRFMLGYYIPCVIAGFGLLLHWFKTRAIYRLIMPLVIFLSIPSVLILMVATYDGVKRHDPLIYITKDEWQAMVWLKENTPADALVVASPEMGLYIPAHTGRRVIYGHPFETIYAEEMESAVLSYFNGELNSNQFLLQYKPDYLFLGPRERKINPDFVVEKKHLVFSNSTVQIFQFSGQ